MFHDEREEYLQKIGCRYKIFIGSKRETIDGKDKKTTTYQIIERPTGQAWKSALLF